MRLSHLCQSCGYDLAPHRPKREPRYGLPLVTCPRCGRAAVRRTHPLVEMRRQAIRFLHSSQVLELQLFMLIASVAFTSTFHAAIVRFISRNGFRLEGPEYVLATIGYLIAPFIAGAWLSAAFPHWRRRWAPWTAWFGLVIIGLGLAWLIAEIEMTRYGGAFRPGRAAEWLGKSLFSLALTLPVMLLGVPLGWLGQIVQGWIARRLRLRFIRRVRASHLPVSVRIAHRLETSE